MHARTRLAVPLAVALLALGGACDGESSEQRACTVGADCASGTCLPDGQCAPVEDTADGADVLFPDATEFPDSASVDDTDLVEDTSVVEDTGPVEDTGSAPVDTTAPVDTVETDTSTGACLPDHNGVVTRAEMPAAAGLTSNYEVTTAPSELGSTPTCDGDGEACAWDLTGLTGDEVVDELYETLDPEGAWWADEPAFAGATFASVMGEFSASWFYYDICSQVQLGVYELTDDALLLLGIVSEQEDDGTLLVYDPPLPMMKFPMQVGDTWTTETTATGPLCNSWADYVIDQTAETSVDAVGSVTTPYGTFEDVLRVNTLLIRHIGIGVLPTRARTQTFVAECFTSIAVIVGEEGVDDTELSAGDIEQVRALTNLP